MNLNVQNYTNPAFNANVIFDKSFEKIDITTREILLPHLQKKISRIGDKNFTVTLKGDDYQYLHAEIKKGTSPNIFKFQEQLYVTAPLYSLLVFLSMSLSTQSNVKNLIKNIKRTIEFLNNANGLTIEHEEIAKK